MIFIIFKPRNKHKQTFSGHLCLCSRIRLPSLLKHLQGQGSESKLQTAPYLQPMHHSFFFCKTLPPSSALGNQGARGDDMVKLPASEPAQIKPWGVTSLLLGCCNTVSLLPATWVFTKGASWFHTVLIAPPPPPPQGDVLPHVTANSGRFHLVFCQLRFLFWKLFQNTCFERCEFVAAWLIHKGIIWA